MNIEGDANRLPTAQTDKLLEKLAQLEREIDELKQVLPKAVAQARVAGYLEGQRQPVYGRLHSYFFECIKQTEPPAEQLPAKAA